MTIEGDRMPKVKSSMKHKGRQAASTADAAGGARQGMVFNTGDFFFSNTFYEDTYVVQA